MEVYKHSWSILKLNVLLIWVRMKVSCRSTVQTKRAVFVEASTHIFFLSPSHTPHWKKVREKETSVAADWWKNQRENVSFFSPPLGVQVQISIQYKLLGISKTHTNASAFLLSSMDLPCMWEIYRAAWGQSMVLRNTNMSLEDGRSTLLIADSPPWVTSLSPVRHISLVARENMVTGFFPSTCLMIGSCPTRPSNWTRFMAETWDSKYI